MKVKVNQKTGRISKYSPSDKRNFLFIYLLILLPILQFLVFWVYVNFNSILLAFKNDVTGAWTTDHFVTLWNNITDTTNKFHVPTMILRSFIIWAVGHLISFPISVLSTYVLYKRVSGHYVFRVIYMLPGLVGGVLWVTMVSSVVSSNGIVVYIMKQCGYTNPAVLEQGLLAAKETAFPTLLFISVLTGIVGGNVIITGAFTKVPPELIDAGKIDGLDFWGNFIHVALPCSWPTISTLLTLSFCTIFVADANVFLYSGGTGEPAMATMGFYFYKLTVDISKTASVYPNYGWPAALGLTITLITVPIVLLGKKLMSKLVPTTQV